jgi:hypothetical protein
MRFEKIFDTVAQFALPVFTLGGLILISLKMPAWGLLANLMAQPFCLYSTYKGWKTAGQWGMFLNTLAYTAITTFGVVNYFILS